MSSIQVSGDVDVEKLAMRSEGVIVDASQFTTLNDWQTDNDLQSLSISKEKTDGIDNDYVYIDFESGDPRNPVNFSNRKKWAITALACFSTVIASSTAPAYNMGFASMIRDLNCTEFQATIGLSVYALGFGLVPLVTAPLSEEFGRRPLYICSSFGLMLMYMMIALSNNIQTVIIARFIQGGFGSTGATMVGGTIADIWSSKQRGLPMSLFAVAAVGGIGLGPAAAGWVEMNSRLEWKWIQWIQMIIGAFCLLLVPIIIVETRASVILTQLARKMRRDTKNERYRAKVEDSKINMWSLIATSCTRPVVMLFTEPVVLSFSLWIGFTWGITYCLIESVSGVFGTLHNFNIGQIGTVFSCMTIGSFIGFLTNLYQESLYQKHFPTRGPEARLYLPCFGAILFPAGMFVYAWCAYPFVPWYAQAIGIVVFMWATFIIYLAVFTYLADCYGPFASSALASQSLARNLMATAFPLFTQQMFKALTYKWANTLFALIAVLMIPIPFVLFFYGPSIRRMSKISRAVIEKL